MGAKPRKQGPADSLEFLAGVVRDTELANSIDIGAQRIESLWGYEVRIVFLFFLVACGGGGSTKGRMSHGQQELRHGERGTDSKVQDESEAHDPHDVACSTTAIAEGMATACFSAVEQVSGGHMKKRVMEWCLKELSRRRKLGIVQERLPIPAMPIICAEGVGAQNKDTALRACMAEGRSGGAIVVTLPASYLTCHEK